MDINGVNLEIFAPPLPPSVVASFQPSEELPLAVQEAAERAQAAAAAARAEAEQYQALLAVGDFEFVPRPDECAGQQKQSTKKPKKRVTFASVEGGE